MASVKNKQKKTSLFLQIASRTRHPGISAVPPTGGFRVREQSRSDPPCSDANIRQRQNSVYQAKNSRGVNPAFPETNVNTLVRSRARAQVPPCPANGRDGQRHSGTFLTDRATAVRLGTDVPPWPAPRNRASSQRKEGR